MTIRSGQATALQTNSLRKLEFPSILARLSSHCRFEPASQLALELQPSTDRWTVDRRLDETDESVRFLTTEPSASIDGARDIRVDVERARKGGRLSPADIEDVGSTLRAAATLKSAISGPSDELGTIPVLRNLAGKLARLPDLTSEISRTIGPSGDVLDSASPELARIRKEVRTAQTRLQDRLNRIVGGSKYAAALQDSIVTTRDGRYVVPVKVDARARVPGVVHDTSASGQTLFVEPFEIVEQNNKWREAQIAERHEIDRILDRLSLEIGDFAPELRETVDGLAAIEFAFAKGRLALEWDCTRPLIQPDQKSARGGSTLVESRVRLKKARHPLIDASEIVAIDVEVGFDFRVLLITGPNTGGKTVALKTVGLHAAMAQAGLFIPAQKSSVTSVFDSIFADIGDDQSIAQNLSTFSSHISSVIEMLENVDAGSLVLIDEIGTGTDPQEGSALARAVVSRLLESRSLVIATTHFSEVKTFAFETEGVENASVQFDVETLSPTYELVIGTPGKSNALAIARRLGMPSEILEDAESRLHPDAVLADRLLQEARVRRSGADREYERASQAAALAEEHLAAAQQSKLASEQERQRAYDDAIIEAESLLKEARQLLRDQSRRKQSDLDKVSGVDQARTVESSVKRALDRVQRRQRPKSRAGSSAKTLRPGDRVAVLSLDQEGEVVRLGAGEADIQLGTIRLSRPLDDLKRVGGPIKKESGSVGARKQSGPIVPMEIDFRGYRAVDVEPELETYLDSAYLANLPSVRVIHGKGTGALRTTVSEILRRSSHVEKYAFAATNDGGDGVTIVTFRDS